MNDFYQIQNVLDPSDECDSPKDCYLDSVEGTKWAVVAGLEKLCIDDE